jgi:hypothetical protein
MFSKYPMILGQFVGKDLHLVGSELPGLAKGLENTQADCGPSPMVQGVEQGASTVEPGHRMRVDAGVYEPEEGLTRGSSALLIGSVPLARGKEVKGPFYRTLDPKDHLGRRTW